MWPTQQMAWRSPDDGYSMHAMNHALLQTVRIPNPQPQGTSPGHQSVEAWWSTNQRQYLPLDYQQEHGARQIAHGLNPQPWRDGRHLPQQASQVNGNYTRVPNGESSPTDSRGPPRQPKRSGHALWVGNLPLGISVVELKDHFAQGLREDIESVYMIPRTMCAFVNYRTEAACKSAQSRFQLSHLNGSILMCRLRRDSELQDGQTPPPSAHFKPRSPIGSGVRAVNGTLDEPQSPVIASTPSSGSSSSTMSEPARVKIPEKFFIMKSLSVQDLEDSVRSKTWATQEHNEAALNKAFRDAKNVYLVFSANKSREYFGFARMKSAIPSNNGEGSPGNKMAASSKRVSPKGSWYIPTPATPSVPKGRIVEDAARGTVFWEVDPSVDGEIDNRAANGFDDFGQDECAGRSFQIEWLNLTRVPFLRTRGLRNPWNDWRKVKIARDGQEIEPMAGQKLLNLFNDGSEQDGTLGINDWERSKPW